MEYTHSSVGRVLGLYGDRHPGEGLRVAGGDRIGLGERENTVTGYERILASGAVDVVGFDPGVAGGVTGVLKVIERVEAIGRHFNAHAWAGAVGSAASLALSAATPSSLVFEVKAHRDPAQYELVSESLEPTGGWIAPPARVWAWRC